MNSKIAQAYTNLKSRYNVDFFLVLILFCHALWVLVPPFMDFETGGLTEKPHQSDFISFWSAARFALEGNALDAYNSEFLKEFQGTVIGFDDPGSLLDWLLPPVGFFLFLPFALLPYSLARFVWIGVTLAAYALVAWKINSRRTALLAALAAPALAYNCIFSQTGALSAALLGGAVILLPKKPVYAGICISFLIFKPQLGVLIPFALIAGRHWRALGAASVATLVLGCAATYCFTPQSWTSFYDALQRTVDINLLSSSAIHGIMQTPYSLIWLATGNAGFAGIVQFIFVFIGLLAVIWVWKDAYSSELKGAVLIVAVAATTFYFQIYEFPMLIIASLLIVREGHKDGFLFLEVDLMVLSAFIPYFYMISDYPLGLISIAIMVFIVARRVLHEHKRMLDIELPSCI